jgi:hypothetical protein
LQNGPLVSRAQCGQDFDGREKKRHWKEEIEPFEKLIHIIKDDFVHLQGVIFEKIVHVHRVFNERIEKEKAEEEKEEDF